MESRRFGLGRTASPNWHYRIETSTTQAAIVETVRELLASLDADEIVRLPAECRPPRIVDAEDVAAYALAIVRHGLNGSESELIARLGRVVVHASTRLSRLAIRKVAA